MATLRGLRHPTRFVPIVFLVAIAVGTVLLMLPFARSDGQSAPLITALFTATSAVSVTGLVTVDTGSYWSPFGQVAILVLFQIGGFGFMTAATLFGLMAGRSFRLSSRLLTQAERSRLVTNDALSVLKLVFKVTISVELAVAAVLMLRLHFGHDVGWGAALWSGVFHAVSAFNNAGFSIHADSLVGYRSDSLMLLPVMIAVIITALGFPVMQEVRVRGLRWQGWTLHTKLTVLGSAILLAVGFVAILLAEWSNPGTLGPMSVPDKLLNAGFHSVMPRSGGFNTVEVGAFKVETLSINYLLMFIGGGSAGTAGGIKITTFFLLLVAVWSEIRRQQDAAIFGRRISPHTERQALTVLVLSAGLIGAGSWLLLALTGLPMQDVLFETISAFATVGLSTGITADLSPAAQGVLIVLMYVGRVGTVTIATALALGDSSGNAYRYPEDKPIVG